MKIAAGLTLFQLAKQLNLLEARVKALEEAKKGLFR